MRAILAGVLVLLLSACGGAADDVCRRPTNPMALGVEPRPMADPIADTCECWDGNRWTPGPASACSSSP